MLDLQESWDTMGMLFKNKTKINSVIIPKPKVG